MNIREKIEAGHYTAPPVRWPVLEKPVVPYPVAKSWYKQPNSAKVYPVEAQAYQDALRERNEVQAQATADAAKRFEIEKTTYTARVEAARVMQAELDDEFWRDVMAEIGMAPCASHGLPLAPHGRQYALHGLLSDPELLESRAQFLKLYVSPRRHHYFC